LGAIPPFFQSWRHGAFGLCEASDGHCGASNGRGQRENDGFVEEMRVSNGDPYNVGPPSYKLVYKPQ